MSSGQSPRSLIGVHYTVPRLASSGWELVDELMPESVLHDHAVELLKALLAAWAARSGASSFVARNLAVRWNESMPQIGVDPDVSVFVPAPPDAIELRSVRTWAPGYVPPLLAIEVVSNTNPHKDYVIAPDKYAASGTGELWIFDPLLAGPAAHGGPFRMQVWHRREDGDFVRLYAGDGPARSPSLGAWLVATDEGRKLRIADDEGATRFWLTAEEAERASKESERIQKESERAQKESERAQKESERIQKESERSQKEAERTQKELERTQKEAERAAKEAALARVAELEAAIAARRAQRQRRVIRRLRYEQARHEPRPRDLAGVREARKVPEVLERREERIVVVACRRGATLRVLRG
jgi:Uma2 family endonuclease